MKKRPSRVLNAAFLALAALCLAYYLLNGIIVRFGQSLLWVWPVISACLLTRWALVRRTIKTGKRSPIPRALLKIMHALLALCVAFFVFVECVIFTGVFESAPQGLDYVIVLGAKVNGRQPSGALRNRIEYASDYTAENPGTIVIASGGQGDDEEISEAECIQIELIVRGVDPERILIEYNSTSTAQNIDYSLALIDAGEHTRVGIITNDFHVYRALRIAKNTGECEFYALPVPTSLLSFPHYMMREFVTVVVDTLRGNL